MVRKAAKGLLKAVVPPLAWSAAQRLLQAVSPPSSGWFPCAEGPSAFSRETTHWSGEELARTYERRWPGFERVLTTPTPAVFASECEPLEFEPGRDLASPAHLMRHNAIMGLVFGVARAARQQAAISLLDWGGGVGHQYGLLRALLPDLKLDCTCFDLPVSVELGAKRFPEIQFTSRFDCLEQQYDLVIANGSLHCFEHWERVAGRLASAAKNFCFIQMTPVRLDGPSQVVIQRWVNPDGSTYAEPEWFISRAELLARFAPEQWRLCRELICGYSPKVHGSDAKVDYRGFLFERVRLREDG